MTERPTAVLLLSKDPVAERGGDVALSRLLMELAADRYDVSAICLSRRTGTQTTDLISGGLTLHRVRKPEVAAAALAARSVMRRRSLVHTRFDVPELRAAISKTRADVWVAEHSYMAEAYLRTDRAAHDRLVVNTHVSESLVWRATRGTLGRMEEPRLIRDEHRVAAAADAVATFDAVEADAYRAAGISDVRWLDLTLPPGAQVEIASTPARLVFLGTRDWPPNQEAFERLVQLWPRIAEGVDGAELVVVGAPSESAAPVPLPGGVRDVGFVDDLAGLLGTCRAMVAPIRTGGGVRVKFLDAARIGLPVVGSPAAVGSLDGVYGLTTVGDDDEFVAQSRRYLLNRDAAVEDGARLYSITEQRWRDRVPHAAVTALLDDAIGR